MERQSTLPQKNQLYADRRVYFWHRESGTTGDADGGGGGHWNFNLDNKQNTKTSLSYFCIIS